MFRIVKPEAKPIEVLYCGVWRDVFLKEDTIEIEPTGKVFHNGEWCLLIPAKYLQEVIDGK